VVHVPLSRTMAMIANGEIRDAKTTILLQSLMIRKLRGVE
jgi:hypothetical protein